MVKPESADVLLRLAVDLGARGAQAVVVVCTELPLLLATDAYPMPAFDVVRLHAEAAVELALAG